METLPIFCMVTRKCKQCQSHSVREVGGMVGVTFLAMSKSMSEPPVPVALFEVASGSYEFVSEYIG